MGSVQRAKFKGIITMTGVAGLLWRAKRRGVFDRHAWNVKNRRVRSGLLASVTRIRFQIVPFSFVAFSNQSTLDCVFKYVAFSWSFSSFPCKQEVKPWKRIPVTGALGPVTISLRFHLLFTRKRWRRLWKRKPNWIYLKTQGYENGTIWKRIRVTGALAGDKFAVRTSSII